MSKINFFYLGLVLIPIFSSLWIYFLVIAGKWRDKASLESFHEYMAGNDN